MDFNALRERLNSLNKKTSKADDLWKPKDEHQVRLVPSADGSDPFKEVYFHYELGDNQQIPCPKMNHGEECAICDFADVLKSWNGPDGEKKPDNERKADFEIFKKIQAKARIFTRMIERGQKGAPDSETAKWWGMTSAQVNQALDVCTDGDRLEALGLSSGDSESLKILFDPKKGYDLTVSYAKPGEKGNAKQYTNITIKGRIKQSPLAKSDADAKKIIDSAKDLSELFPKVSSTDIEKILKKFVGRSSEEAKPEGGVEKYSGSEKQAVKPANTKENAKVSGTRSIDEAFGDMVADD